MSSLTFNCIETFTVLLPQADSSTCSSHSKMILKFKTVIMSHITCCKLRFLKGSIWGTTSLKSIEKFDVTTMMQSSSLTYTLMSKFSLIMLCPIWLKFGKWFTWISFTFSMFNWIYVPLIFLIFVGVKLPFCIVSAQS